MIGQVRDERDDGGLSGLDAAPLGVEEPLPQHLLHRRCRRDLRCEPRRDVSNVAFSGVQAFGVLDPGCGNLVAVDSGVFPVLRHHVEADEEAEEPVMVHAGMLSLFHSMLKYTNFESQVNFFPHPLDLKTLYTESCSNTCYN
ncbi:hypothetical protein Acr_00g0029010 [Actinidia rufa]|uniref:Uncharacterized protein n=1 Tax=Actinidia rufa TaxID=165716 RepID=A0A7J0DEH1_9ERIC|nr:hypothetical protein Acr_00g0029010 [Actinidia rufa]